jgi:hypothetical protein
MYLILALRKHIKTKYNFTKNLIILLSNKLMKIAKVKKDKDKYKNKLKLNIQ